MIVRCCYRCRTCGQGHTLRLGMGQEVSHTYRFPCVECGEEMAVTMHVDYVEVSTSVEETENAEVIEESADCVVVNLHANFVIPADLRHQDKAFPHLAIMNQMVQKAIDAGQVGIPASKALVHQNERPYRRPDFDAEWKLLKKAWSLHRRGKDKLSKRLIEQASVEFYSNDALNDISDWVWRFALFSTGVEYEPKLRAAMEVIKVPLSEGKLAGILEHLDHSALDCGEQYHAIIRDYFAAWSEFSQVHFSVATGIDMSGLSAKTANFASVQMYYGNAFEMFASMIEILTMINNVLAERNFDQLANITLDQYRASDKGKRFDAPSQNEAFAALCVERDNQLRNASHHRELKYNQTTGIVSFRTGKGAAGELRELSYGDYLCKCSRMHHQVVVLLRLHLLIAQIGNIASPV